jgi:hypothetical protein
MRLGARLRLLGLAILVFVAAGCGSTPSATGDRETITLATWSTRLCKLLADTDPPTATATPSTSMFSARDAKRGLALTRRRADLLDRFPLPDIKADDAAELLTLLARVTAVSIEQAPRIADAQRRLDSALESIDPADIPEKAEGETVAGSIMSHLMSVPEYRDAFNDMMDAYGDISRSVDSSRLEHLATELGLDDCEPPGS